MNRISAWSIRHPVPTVVLFLALLMAGVCGFLQLRINNMPDIDLPMVTVTVSQNGRLADRNRDTGDQDRRGRGRRSRRHRQHYLDGERGQFDNDYRVRTRHRRRSRRPTMSATPCPASRTTYRMPPERRSSRAATRAATPSSPMSYRRRTWLPTSSPGMSTTTSAGAMLSVSGVAKVQRSGGVERAVRVELDPQRLSGRGITAAEVSDALAAENVNMPGGRTTVGAQEQSVRTLGSTLSDRRPRQHPDCACRRQERPPRRISAPSPTPGRSRGSAPGSTARRSSLSASTARSGRARSDVTKAVRAKVNEIAKTQSDVTFQEITSSSDFVSRELRRGGRGTLARRPSRHRRGLALPARPPRDAGGRHRHAAVADPDLRGSAPGSTCRSTPSPCSPFRWSSGCWSTTRSSRSRTSSGTCGRAASAPMRPPSRQPTRSGSPSSLRR